MVEHALIAIVFKALSLGKSRLWSQLRKGDLNPPQHKLMQVLGHWIDCHGQAGLDSQGRLRAVNALHILGDNQTAQAVMQNDSLFPQSSDFHRILNLPT